MYLHHPTRDEFDLPTILHAFSGSINPSSLSVGYFPDPRYINYVTELLDADADLLNQTSVFAIWHFSGYMVAVGRGAPEE